MSRKRSLQWPPANDVQQKVSSKLSGKGFAVESFLGSRSDDSELQATEYQTYIPSGAIQGFFIKAEELSSHELRDLRSRPSI
jgi:hypothetical protein